MAPASTRQAGRRGPRVAPPTLAPPPLRVEVRQAKGDVLSLEVPTWSTARDLKLRIAEAAAKAPPLCQRLLVGSDVLGDAEMLLARLEEGREGLQVMMLVSLEEAQKHLGSGSPSVRLEALEAFAQVAPRGKRGSMSAVSALLNDPVPKVRAAALTALVALSEPEDARAVPMLTERLGDASAEVRGAALQALVRVAPADCGRTFEAVRECLSDGELSVVHHGLEALAQLASRGGGDKVLQAIADQALQAIADQLGHRSAEIRIAAMKVLTRVSPDREDIADAVARLLEDRDKLVKQEALLALSILLPDEAQRDVVSACARLRHGRTEARALALKNLARSAPLGDPRMVSAVCACILDKNKGLRAEGLKALQLVAERGDEQAISAVIACLADPRPEVKLAALGAVLQVAPSLHERAIDAVAALDSDAHVRHDARRVLRVLESPEEPAGRSAVFATGVLHFKAHGPSKKVAAAPFAARAERDGKSQPSKRLVSVSSMPTLPAILPSRGAALLQGGDTGLPTVPVRNHFLAAAGMLMEEGPAWRSLAERPSAYPRPSLPRDPPSYTQFA